MRKIFFLGILSVLIISFQEPKNNLNQIASKVKASKDFNDFNNLEKQEKIHFIEMNRYSVKYKGRFRNYSSEDRKRVYLNNKLTFQQKCDSLKIMGMMLPANLKEVAKKKRYHFAKLLTEIPELSSLSRTDFMYVMDQARKN